MEKAKNGGRRSMWIVLYAIASWAEIVVTSSMFSLNDDYLNTQFFGMCVGITLELVNVRDHGTILERYKKSDVMILRCRSLLRILVNETRPSERLESKSMKYKLPCSKNLIRAACSHDGIVSHFQIAILIGWQRVRGENVTDR
jgi:hypothetical protein